MDYKEITNKINDTAILKEKIFLEIIIETLKTYKNPDIKCNEGNKAWEQYNFNQLNSYEKSIFSKSGIQIPETPIDLNVIWNNSDNINSKNIIEKVIRYEVLKEWSKNTIYLTKKENVIEHIHNISMPVISVIIDKSKYKTEELEYINSEKFNLSGPLDDYNRAILRKKLENHTKNKDFSDIGLKYNNQNISLLFKIPPLYYCPETNTGYYITACYFCANKIGIFDLPQNIKEDFIDRYIEHYEKHIEHMEQTYNSEIAKFMNNKTIIDTETACQQYEKEIKDTATPKWIQLKFSGNPKNLQNAKNINIHLGNREISLTRGEYNFIYGIYKGGKYAPTNKKSMKSRINNKVELIIPNFKLLIELNGYYVFNSKVNPKE